MQRVILNLIQIERPGEPDGSVIPWKSNQMIWQKNVANELNLKVISPSNVVESMETNSLYNSTEDENVVYRKIAGVSEDENIFLNGIVVGKSTSSDVTLDCRKWNITKILGGEIKEHGVEKLGRIELDSAVVKTGF